MFDEAHTFTGALGAETACLIRRLRAFCRTDPARTTCIATSATIVDQDDPQAGRNFAPRFFGVAGDAVTTVGEDYETEVWTERRFAPPAPGEDTAAILDLAVQAVEDGTSMGTDVREVYRTLAGEELGTGDWPKVLHAALSRNELVFALNEELATPRALEELHAAMEARIGRPVTEAEILAWLTLGAAARRDGRPLLRPVVHGFVRGIGGVVVSFLAEGAGPRFWLAAEDDRAAAAGGERLAQFPVATCTVCGQHYYIAFLRDFTFTKRTRGRRCARGGILLGAPGKAARRPAGRTCRHLGRGRRGRGDDGPACPYGPAPLLPQFRRRAPDGGVPLPRLRPRWRPGSAAGAALFRRSLSRSFIRVYGRGHSRFSVF